MVYSALSHVWTNAKWFYLNCLAELPEKYLDLFIYQLSNVQVWNMWNSDHCFHIDPLYCAETNTSSDTLAPLCHSILTHVFQVTYIISLLCSFQPAWKILLHAACELLCIDLFLFRVISLSLASNTTMYEMPSKSWPCSWYLLCYAEICLLLVTRALLLHKLKGVFFWW